jgi:glycosyltransferase involved in cell wall biosynthesis
MKVSRGNTPLNEDTMTEKKQKYPLEVLIPTRNRPQVLAKTLDCLARQKDIAYRVLLRDEGKENSIEHPDVKKAIAELNQKGHPVTAWRDPVSHGYGYARYPLIRKASARHLFFLDDDVIMTDDDVLIRMYRELRRYPASFCAAYTFQSNTLSMKPTHLFEYAITGFGFGCVMIEREKILSAGAFDFYRHIGRRRGMDDGVQYQRLVSQYGPGRTLPCRVAEYQESRAYPRSLDVGLTDPLSTFFYLKVKIPHFDLPSALLLSEEAFEWLKETRALSEDGKWTSLPPAATQNKKALEDAASKQSPKIQGLIDQIKDPKMNFLVAHHAAELRALKCDKAVILKIMAELDAGKDAYGTTQLIKTLTFLGPGRHWEKLMHVARREPSLLKYFIVSHYMRMAESRQILIHAKIWLRSRDWRNQIGTFLMVRNLGADFETEKRKLFQALWDVPDEMISWNAIAELAKRNDPQFRKKILNALDRYPSVKRQQIYWFLYEQKAVLGSFLIAKIKAETDWRARLNAIMALRGASFQKSVRDFLSVLADAGGEADEMIRAFAILAMESGSWNKNKPVILRALSDPSELVKRAAVLSLHHWRQLGRRLEQIIGEKPGSEMMWQLAIHVAKRSRIDWFKPFFNSASSTELFNTILHWNDIKIQYHLRRAEVIQLFSLMEHGTLSDRHLAAYILAKASIVGRYEPLVAARACHAAEPAKSIAVSNLTDGNILPFKSTLERALHSSNPAKKKLAIWNMGRGPLPIDETSLAACAMDQDPDIACLALEALLRSTREPKNLHFLDAAFKEEASLGLRFFTAKKLPAFSKLEKTKFLETLFSKLIHDSNWLVRQITAEKLGQ